MLKQKLAIGLLAVILATAAVLAVANRFAPTKTPSQPTSQAEEVRALTAKVGAHILVKQDEIPNVATVEDPDLLRSQSPVFYKDARKGDRLLVWSDKAVLFSPARNLIIAVVMANPAPPQATVAETSSVEVRNGSGKSGLAKSLAQKLAAAGLTVLPPGDAKAVIASTIIVKAAGKELPDVLKKLQSLTGASVAELPAGEAAPKGDFLVIVGADYKL